MKCVEMCGEDEWPGLSHDDKWVPVTHDFFATDAPENFKEAMANQVSARLPTCPPAYPPACPPIFMFVHLHTVMTHAWVLCCGAQILLQEEATTAKKAALAEVEKLKGPPLPLPALPAHSSFCDPWP